MIDRAIPNLTRAGALTLLSLAIHCGDAPEPTDGVLCTAELRTAVRVFVRDEAGQPLRADSVFASFEGSPGGDVYTTARATRPGQRIFPLSALLAHPGLRTAARARFDDALELPG